VSYIPERLRRNYVLAAKSFCAAAHIALRDIVQDWNKPSWSWMEAAGQLAIMFGERITAAVKGCPGLNP
jgi:hypothetical protein